MIWSSTGSSAASNCHYGWYGGRISHNSPYGSPGNAAPFCLFMSASALTRSFCTHQLILTKPVILFGQLSRIITDLQDAAAHGKVATRVAQTGVHILPGFPPQRPQLQDSLVRKAFKWCFQPYLGHIRRGSALGRNCATASAGVRVHTEVGANPLTASFNSTVATNPCRAPRRLAQLGFRVSSAGTTDSEPERQLRWLAPAAVTTTRTRRCALSSSAGVGRADASPCTRAPRWC